MEEHQSSKKRFDFYLSCCVYYFSSYDLRRAKGCLSENFSKRIVRVVLGMCIVNGSLSLSLSLSTRSRCNFNSSLSVLEK